MASPSHRGACLLHFNLSLAAEERRDQPFIVLADKC